MGRHKQSLKELTELPLSRIRLWGEDTPDTEAEKNAVSKLASDLMRMSSTRPVLVIGLVTKAEQKEEYLQVTERRLVQAAQKAGLPEIPCIVLKPESMREAEVIHRLEDGDHEPWQLADTLQRLKKDYAWTQAQLGQAIGKTRDYVANILAITNIQPEVRAYLIAQPDAQHLTARHLRYVGRAKPVEQMKTAGRIIRERLSTKILEGENLTPKAGKFPLEIIPIRAIHGKNNDKALTTPKEWRRYYRQLNTDLSRIKNREAEALEKNRRIFLAAKLKQRDILKEAREKKALLTRELRRVVKHLSGIK